MLGTCPWHEHTPPVADLEEARGLRDFWDIPLTVGLTAELIVSISTETPCCQAGGFARYLMMAVYREGISNGVTTA